MSSVQAMEEICGVTVTPEIAALRRLLYCGEWIESHALHVYMLHAPDFLGYASAIELAGVAPEVVERALRMKKLGNRLMTVVGGREVHPINVRVGGWYRAPEPEELAELVHELEWVRGAALETVAWAATLDFPDFEQDYEFVALDQPGLYPIDSGRTLVSSKGLEFDISDFREPHPGAARRALERAARADQRRRHLHGRPARPLRALRGPALARRARGGASRRGSSRSSGTRSRASSSARSSWSRRRRRRCA